MFTIQRPTYRRKCPTRIRPGTQRRYWLRISAFAVRRQLWAGCTAVEQRIKTHEAAEAARPKPHSQALDCCMGADCVADGV